MPDRAIERDIYHALLTFGDRVLVDFLQPAITRLPEEGFMATVRETSYRRPLDATTAAVILDLLEVYRSSFTQPPEHEEPYLWFWVRDGQLIADLLLHLATIEHAAKLLSIGRIEPRIYECSTGHTLRPVMIPRYWGGPQ